MHRAAGASFTDFAGWQMPVRYSSDLAEHHAVRTSAGLFDLSHMGEIVLIGPQAAAALDFALAGNDEDDFDARIAALKYYRSFPATFEGQPVLIARTGRMSRPSSWP